jgi:hypothetical protein
MKIWAPTSFDDGSASLDDVGHSKRFATTRDTKKCLLFFTGLQPLYQLSNRRRLITCRLVTCLQAKLLTHLYSITQSFAACYL